MMPMQQGEQRRHRTEDNRRLIPASGARWNAIALLHVLCDSLAAVRRYRAHVGTVSHSRALHVGWQGTCRPGNRITPVRHSCRRRAVRIAATRAAVPVAAALRKYCRRTAQERHRHARQHRFPHCLVHGVSPLPASAGLRRVKAIYGAGATLDAPHAQLKKSAAQ